MKINDIYIGHKNDAVSFMFYFCSIVLGIFLIYSVLNMIYIISSLQKQLVDNNIQMNKIQILLNDIQKSLSNYEPSNTAKYVENSIE
jgi:uncharacterized protein with PQ loop repeat